MVVALAHGLAVGRHAADGVGVALTGAHGAVGVGRAGHIAGDDGPVIGTGSLAVDHIGLGVLGGLPHHGDAAGGCLGGGHGDIVGGGHGGGHGGGNAGAVIALAHGLAVGCYAADGVGIALTDLGRGVVIAGAVHAAGDDGPVIGAGGLAVDRVGLGALGGLPRHGDAADIGLGGGHGDVGGDGGGAVRLGGDAGAVIALAHGPAVGGHAADGVGVALTGLDRGVGVAGAVHVTGDDDPVVGTGDLAVDGVGHGVGGSLPRHGDALLLRLGGGHGHIIGDAGGDLHRHGAAVHGAVVHGLHGAVANGVDMGLFHGKGGLAAGQRAVLHTEGQRIQVAGDGQALTGGIQQGHGVIGPAVGSGLLLRQADALRTGGAGGGVQLDGFLIEVHPIVQAHHAGERLVLGGRDRQLDGLARGGLGHVRCRNDDGGQRMGGQAQGEDQCQQEGYEFFHVCFPPQLLAVRDLISPR